MSKTIDQINDHQFETQVTARPGLVLLNFTATWCGPCKALAPVLSDVADEYEGRVRVAKMDLDECKASAEKLTVRGVPSLLMFVDGVEKGRIVGVVSKTRLAAFIDGHLPQGPL